MTRALTLVLAATAACGRPDLAEIRDLPLDIRYATQNNFTGQRLYEQPRCFLRPDTARKLRSAANELAASGLQLKLFDCYRPLSVQRKLWDLVPDERYVASPAKGSRHNRGAAVDLTLIRASDGAELPMPTGYDDFTAKAHRSFTALPPEAIENRALLERVMSRHGFVGLPTEWWHFDDSNWEQYSILDISFDKLPL